MYWPKLLVYLIFLLACSKIPTKKIQDLCFGIQTFVSVLQSVRGILNAYKINDFIIHRAEKLSFVALNVNQIRLQSISVSIYLFFFFFDFMSNNIDNGLLLKALFKTKQYI